MFRGEKQQGFTLIELMVVIAIVAIVITLSTPISNLFRQNRITSIEHEFVTSLNLARGAAVSNGNSVTICSAAQANPPVCAPANANGNRQWENGWIVFNDPNANGAIDPGETVLQQHAALAAGYTLRESQRGLITYNNAGITPNSAGTWSVCDPTQNAQFQRGITLNVSGRVTLLPSAQIAAIQNCLVP